MSKIYITTPIYYVNAAPHIGSAYTTIAADVLARWYKSQGKDVHFITGLAEHGDKIAASAEATGQSVQEFADRNAELFHKAWNALNIQPDDFIRTSEDRHATAVAEFFTRLKDSGKIYEGEYSGLYCVGHEAFMKESELDENGLCPDHKKAPEKITEKNWFFKLSDYGKELTKLIESDKLQVNPASKKSEVLSFINQGLEDIAISRQSVDNALPLPWDDSQTIYVWLDELWSYQTASDGNWPATVHLVGKDIIKFHCIIWPALLLAIGEELPKQVFAHGFFTVNGQKISKSLGNAIDPVELVTEYSADVIRYFVLRDIPFGNDGDFSHERLKERYNADLANGLGNLVSRILNLIEKNEIALPLSKAGSEGISEVSGFMQSLHFDKALDAIWKEIQSANEHIEQTKPWELAKKTEKREELEEVLKKLYNQLLSINKSIAPFMPETHKRLAELLNTRPIQKPVEPLFARLHD